MKYFLILLLAVLSACSSADIKSTEQAPGADLTAYKTYNFLAGEVRNEDAFRMANVSLDELKLAVAREMEQRGYRRADKPDLWVNIGVVAEKQVQTRQTDFRTDPAARYIGQRYYHWEAREVPVGTYEVGTVTVDVVDASRNDLVWQGVTATPLAKDPDKTARRINEGITELFRRYPLTPR